MNKQELRKEFQAKRCALSQERRQEAQVAAARLTFSERAIVSYCAIRDELDLSELNSSLASKGKLILPKITEGHLDLYWVDRLDGTLTPNEWGILEPIPEQCEPARLEEVEVILVPALAFDKAGHRLGYGKGYYDKLLPLLPKARLVGIGFHEQEMEELPSEPHDCPLGRILFF